MTGFPAPKSKLTPALVRAYHQRMVNPTDKRRVSRFEGHSFFLNSQVIKDLKSAKIGVDGKHCYPSKGVPLLAGTALGKERGRSRSTKSPARPTT